MAPVYGYFNWSVFSSFIVSNTLPYNKFKCLESSGWYNTHSFALGSWNGMRSILNVHLVPISFILMNGMGKLSSCYNHQLIGFWECRVGFTQKKLGMSRAIK